MALRMQILKIFLISFTHCGPATLQGVVDLGHHGSGNGLSPIRRQPIAWANVDKLEIEYLNFIFDQ